MKRIKLNRLQRRLLRFFTVLFLVWIVWSIFYYASWTRQPEKSTYPTTIGVTSGSYSKQIDEATSHLKGITNRLNVPSFSVAVGHKGKVIWSAAEGFASLETQTSATPKTQYRVGSTSKAITATGVAKLVDMGKINLNSIIGDTIVNWSKKRWDFTMKQLLSHTAGVGNYTDFGLASARYTLCNCNQFNTASEGLKVFNNYKLLYEPGTKFQYSTFDINLASVVLEQAANKPFLDFMNEQVFEPLQMTSTYADHSKPITEHFATFYETKDNYYREYRNLGMAYDINLSYKWAGGGFISTPTDLVKLGNAYLTDAIFISEKTRKEFWTPVKLTDGQVNEQQYALGWRSWPEYKNELLLNGEEMIWMVHHGGVSKGSMNFLVLFPNYDFVIDASINARAETFDDFAKEVRQLANFFLTTIKKKELTNHLLIKKHVE